MHYIVYSIAKLTCLHAHLFVFLIMKNLILIGLLCLVSSFLYSQKIDLGSSDKSYQRSFLKVIGQNSKGIFILKSSSTFNSKQEQVRLRDNKAELMLVGNNLNTLWSYSLTNINPEADIQDVCIFNDSLYLFYALINKEYNKNGLFVQKINATKGMLDSAPILLDEISFDKKRNRGMFYIKKSKDGKLICSMYKQTDSENEKLNISISVFDSSFAKTWSHKYKTDYYDGVLFLNDFKLSNDGKAFILTSLDLDKKLLRDKKYTLNVCSPENEKIISISIILDKYFINDLKMEIDYINNQVVLAGFYSELNSFSSAGITYVRISLFDFKPKLFTESFKAKFLNEFNTERTVNRGTELINYYIDKIILRTDGGVILLSESNYVTESTNYNSYYQLYTTSYTYHYDNILLFSINPNGKIHWESIVRKNQVSEDDAAFYSSYIVNLDSDKLNIIYNKYIRKSTDIICCTINNRGENSEKVIIKENDHLLLMPGGGKQISADQIIIPCIQKNKTNFIRVTY